MQSESAPFNSTTTRVPATTANLGPGYDCLGIGLQIYNSVTVTRLDSDAANPSGMAAQAAGLYFETTGIAPFGFDWTISGDVPQSRGMGSSVTVRLGLLNGINELAGRPLGRSQLFELCAKLEGHPDNAAPAAFGGFTVCGGQKIARFEVSSDLAFVMLIPDFEVATPDARRVLPKELERLSAVKSCANACRITAAFATADYEMLRGAFWDGLHQPFREPLIPFLNEVVKAGEDAGAIGGFLSGSGSTICCVTMQDPNAVAAAMKSASGNAGAYSVVTHADNIGMQTL